MSIFKDPKQERPKEGQKVVFVAKYGYVMDGYYGINAIGPNFCALSHGLGDKKHHYDNESVSFWADYKEFKESIKAE